MELDERKKKILKAVIKSYLDTGEPVGSRTISKYGDFSLSPATIRNEMADLEEMGYLVQPHTSAGRIPTDAGYRIYVDAMLAERSEELDERSKKLDTMQDAMNERIDKIEDVLKSMAKMLANDTNYTSVVSMPKTDKNKLKFVQLTQVDPENLLVTAVLERNIVKNRMVKVEEALGQEEILALNLLFNNTLNGLTLAEINFDMAAQMAGHDPKRAELITEILNVIVGTIGAEDGMKIFTSGATNIFKYPELSDKTSASGLISALEEKDVLGNLLVDQIEGDGKTTGVQVYIGSETAVDSMKDCSVVTATYEFEEGVYGKIGIIGPKRMDYEKVLDALKDVTGNLDTKFSDSKPEKTADDEVSEE